MKKILFLILALLLTSAGQIRADVNSANVSHKAFMSLANAGGDKGQLYNSLYKAYQDNSELLKSSSPNSAGYSQAIANLRDQLPYLANGAAYSNQMRNTQNALLFAKAFVDTALLPEFIGQYAGTPQFAQLSYYAAANHINRKPPQYAEAIPYLSAYIRSGEAKNRKNVTNIILHAATETRNTTLGNETVDRVMSEYPTDFAMLSTAINYCIDQKQDFKLQSLVDKALQLRPNDPTLLNISGKMYEDNREYDKAIAVYQNLRKIKPNALDVMKHLALNKYNIGVLNYNKALYESDKGSAKKLKKAYEDAFSEAVEYLTAVVNSDPASVKFQQALAVAYKCIGEMDKFASANNKLASMGGGKIADDYVPALMAYGQDSGTAPGVMAQNVNTAPRQSALSSAAGQAAESTDVTEEIPPYDEWAKAFIEERVNKWQQKDPYETLTEYQARVTENSRQEKAKEVGREAEDEYVRNFSKYVNLSSLELKPYDAENGVFLISSDVGEMILPVPRENNEARIFESNWAGMQHKDPKYFIADNRLAIAALTFVTPMGKEYHYDNSKALNYTETNVDVRFNPIDISDGLIASGSNAPQHKISKQNVAVGVSDVDRDIPEGKRENPKTFAVIISNENYMNVANVPFALNDGNTFAEYCCKTLGLPQDHVRVYKDASFGVMLRAMHDIRDIASAYNGDLDIIFYYAGHGIPNESTKDAFLLPTDADGTQTEACYSLNRLYQELGETNARQITVFLDACFSGSQRTEGGEMLASARGVKLKPKATVPAGNMVIFSAASDDETAFPYQQEGHGLFTYYLLKKLKESKGNSSLGELSDYISENVRRQSVVANRKVQTPAISASGSLNGNWRDKKLK